MQQKIHYSSKIEQPSDKAHRVICPPYFHFNHAQSIYNSIDIEWIKVHTTYGIE